MAMIPFFMKSVPPVRRDWDEKRLKSSCKQKRNWSELKIHPVAQKRGQGRATNVIDLFEVWYLDCARACGACLGTTNGRTAIGNDEKAVESESGLDEFADVPAVDELERGLAGGVVAAGQDAHLVVDAVAAKLLHHLP